MPLSEFLRMSRRRLDSDQQKPSQTGFSNRGEGELVELVWENGQIMIQGQSSRPARNLTLHNSPKFRDSRTEKLGDVESMLSDLSPVVPSADLDLSQDDEMVPWLNYQVEDSLRNYCNEFLPEISGVTGNGQNSFVLPDKKSSCHQNKARLACSWPPQLGQASDSSLVSGVTDIVSNNMSKGVVNNSTGTKETQNNMGMPSNSSNFLNVSHFSRPGTLVKRNLPIGDGLPASVKGSSVKSRFVDQLNTPKGFDFNGPSSSKTSPAERTENRCRENSIKNDKPPFVRHSNGDPAKGVGDGERSVEPMVASSSVGSGNSGDRISCEQTHNSKRKFHDIEESEGHDDDIETECGGLRKPASGRGGGGSKRGRAAEVHNLSERRRRDRINEKMRALQELIPSCNKADKASMLDEAIEYLKTLQLQVQMMSMGAGLCMPPMMFPPGVLPAHLPHFSHMGVGMGMSMGMGMGYGMGMADMNAGSSQYPMYPAPPMQGTHFPSPMSGPVNFQRLPAPIYGHRPSQGIPTSVPLALMVSSTARPPVTSAIDSSALQTKTGEASCSMNPNLLQPTNEVSDKSAVVRENTQVTDVIGTTALTPTKSIDISKVDGGD